MEDRQIIRLNEDLIGKIAAGEVVENPASAIKEMVENSLDSGATCITVEIRDGGISFVRVTDNGRGIRNRDIRMAFERHATSKIVTADDLYNLNTLGFRGEALASIAAVSKLTMTTHRVGEKIGTRVINEGGTIKEITEAAAPQGTTIVLRDLFYNTPVRLKFLKKPNAEAAKVADVIQRMILSRPDISFRLINNNRQVYSSSGNGDLRSAVFCLYGRETAANMVKVHAEGSVSIEGLVGVGQEARSNRARQTFIINGRSIHSQLLSQALEDGAKERYTIGHYPICVLHIKMPSTLVDVNVHPNKLEVRFSDENLIYQKVYTAVHDAFSISPLSGAPELVDSSRKETVSIPIQVIETDTEAGLAQAVSVIQENLSSSDSQDMQSETANRFISPEIPDVRSENVPDIQISETQKPVTDAPSQVAHTDVNMNDEDSTAEQDPRPEKSDELDFASIVANYFGESVRPDSDTLPVQEVGRDTSVFADGGAPVKEMRPAERLPMEPGTDLPTAEEVNALYTSRPKNTEQGEQLKLILDDVEKKDDVLAEYQYVGTAFDTYIILQNRKQLLFIDQHAAHERILYEKLMRQIDEGTGSQMLLIPQIIHATPQEALKINTYIEEIRNAGYDIESFGDADFKIQAVPNVLGQPETMAAFHDMVDHLGELRVLSTKQKRRDAILQMACKHAIKGGDKLAQEEIASLLSEMQKTGAPPTCPHGRPLVVVLTRTELEKRFRRIND